MTVYLIRHGLTKGNLEGRYIGGRTDEPLCPEGIAGLRARTYPHVERVFISPMRRCKETAAILYPNTAAECIEDLKECDFGDYEGMNYAQLNGQAAYQAFIDSGGELPFPGGESRAAFATRSVRAYAQAIAHLQAKTAAFVVHGGTIMAIMERYARPKGCYFDFQVKNGEGYALYSDGTYKQI